MIRRMKGTGSVRKIGDAYYFRIKINGRETCKRMSAKNDEEAAIEADRHYVTASARTTEEIALFAGRARKIIEEDKRIRLAEVCSTFRASAARPECGVSTMQQHERSWLMLLSWLPPGATANDLTIETMERFFAWVATQKAARTFNATLVSIRLIIRIVYPGLGNPCRTVRRRREQTEHHRHFDAGQLARVFDAVDGGYPLAINCHDDMRLLFRLAAYTGMRLIDCVLLRWGQIDAGQRTIAVTPRKTQHSSGVTVAVPIHAELWSMLTQRERGVDDDYVMPAAAERYRRNPSGVDRTACRVIWWALAEQPDSRAIPQKIDGYGFHSFRHSFVSFCANAGVPLVVVREIVGHNSETVTRIYSHIASDVMRQAVNAVPGRMVETETFEQFVRRRLKRMTGANWQAIKKEILSR